MSRLARARRDVADVLVVGTVLGALFWYGVVVGVAELLAQREAARAEVERRYGR